MTSLVPLMFKKFRYRQAFFFGRLEHAAARLLFGFLLLTYFAYYLERRWWMGFMLICDITCWLIYWFCHQLEKFFRPKDRYGRRI